MSERFAGKTDTKLKLWFLMRTLASSVKGVYAKNCTYRHSSICSSLFSRNHVLLALHLQVLVISN